MDAFAHMLLGLGGAVVANIVFVTFFRGLLPKPLGLLLLVYVGFGLVGATAVNLALLSGNELSPGLQAKVDVAAAREADLKRRIAVNDSALRSTLAETPSATDTPTLERDEAWRKRIGDLVTESRALSGELGELTKQIAPLQTEAAAAAVVTLRKRLTIALLAEILFGLFVVWIAGFNAARESRIEARRAEMRARGLDPMAVSDQVRQLAESGQKLAAIKAYHEETGAGLAESKNAVESLSGRRASRT